MGQEGADMSDSKEWALGELGKANTIYEPGERDGLSQAIDFLIWSAEIALIWYVASRFVAI